MLQNRFSGHLFSRPIKNHTQQAKRLEVLLHISRVLDSEIAAGYSALPQILIGCLLGVRYIAKSLGLSGEERTLSAIKGLLEHMVQFGRGLPKHCQY